MNNPRVRVKGNASELRCPCRRLLAKVSGRAVILKCPRCKREAVLFVEELTRTGEVEVVFTR